MGAPRVSVVMPTYNRADYILESLNSIFRQDYTDYEIIVVDDDSTDHTEDLLGPLMERITYLRQSKSGTAEARNLGIKYSRGDLIAFLDSDDLWLKGKLGIQVRYMDENPCIGLVFTDLIRINTEGRQIGPRASARRLPSLTLSDLIGPRPSIWIGTVMLRREWLDLVGGFDRDCWAEDYDLWVMLALHGCRFAYLPAVTAKWRRHPNTKSRNLVRMLESHIQTLNKLKWMSKKIDPNPKLEKLVCDAIRRQKRSLVYNYLQQGNEEKSRTLAEEIFNQKPFDPRSCLVYGMTIIPKLEGIHKTILKFSR